jgi:hypothetical protein
MISLPWPEGVRLSLSVLASFSFQALNNPTVKPFQQRSILIYRQRSAEYEGKDPLKLAKQAERDINSYGNKTGNARAGASDSSKSRLLFHMFIRVIQVILLILVA